MDPERRRRLVALGEWHRRWAAGADADATAEFRPEGRRDGSDYNEHHVDVDADPALEDVFHAGARHIMGLDPTTGRRTQ